MFVCRCVLLVCAVREIWDSEVTEGLDLHLYYKQLDYKRKLQKG